jgi:hypothetical protein
MSVFMIKQQTDWRPDSKDLNYEIDYGEVVENAQNAFKAVLKYAEAGDKIAMDPTVKSKEDLEKYKDLVENLNEYRKSTQNLMNVLHQSSDKAFAEVHHAMFDESDLKAEDYTINAYLKNIKQTKKESEDVAELLERKTRRYRNNSNSVSPTSHSTASKGKSTLSAKQVPASIASARKIVNKYGSLPGGVTIEGDARSLNGIYSAAFDRRNNRLMINKSRFYYNPILPKEMSTIFKAIADKNEFGVSLGGGFIVYGGLKKEDEIALAMQFVDWFFASLTYGWYNFREDIDWFKDYRLAKSYRMEVETDKTNTGLAYYNFNGYEFKLSGNIYRLVSSNIKITIIPQSKKQKAKDGGALPDYDAITKGLISPIRLKNIQHIVRNIDYYGQERIVRKVNSYGEVAAFARALKRNGIDLKRLALQIDSIAKR